MTRTELFEFWPETVQVGLRIPVGVVDREVDRGVALLGELDHALDVVLGHCGLAWPRTTSRFSAGLSLRIEAVVAVDLAIDAGLHDGVQVLRTAPWSR